MAQYKSEHYLFHYSDGSPAQRDIDQIAAHQETCFAYICKVLKITPDFMIEYFLCNTPEEVGTFYGDNDPCNGFARMPNRIYAVYNENVTCIGFHEDAHILSYRVNRPLSAAVREGLAMFFDKKWWGVTNHDWTLYYIRSGQYVPIDRLIENDVFFAVDCAVSYPIMGAFTEYLLHSYGSDRYMDFYRCTGDADKAFLQAYGKSPGELDREFFEYTSLFSIDAQLESRICELTRRF